MTEPTAPAVTPAAQPQGGNEPATPAPQPGTTPAPTPQPNPTPTLLTQEQADAIFNQRWAEKMGGIEKELGIQPGGFKDFVAAQKKPKVPPAGATDPLTGADLRIAKMEALMLAGVPSKKIPGLLSRVQGKTKADIEADIQFMLSEGFFVLEQPAPAQPVQNPTVNTPPPAAQGAGNSGLPPGPKVWTRAEIKSLTPGDYAKNRDDIMKAMSEGRIKD